MEEQPICHFLTMQENIHEYKGIQSIKMPM